MLEVCLGSYLVIAALATILIFSALILGRRTDRIRYGIHFWSGLAQAKQESSVRFEVYELDEEDFVQPGNERARLPQPVPRANIRSSLN
jgi:hypothetical protein